MSSLRENKKNFHANNLLLLMIFVSIAISGIGIYVDLLFINPLLISMILLILTIALKAEVNIKLFLIFIFFSLHCFIGAFSRFGLASFLPSLLITCMFMLTLTVEIKLKTETILRYFQFSLGIISFICLFEFTAYNLSPSLWKSIETFILLQGGTLEYDGVRRLRGAFLEPSLLGITLNYFYLAYLFFYKTLNRSFTREFIIILILVLMTFSTSAYLCMIVITLIFFFSNLFSSDKLGLPSTFVPRRTGYYFFGIILISFILFNFFDNQIIKSIERLSIIASVINENNVIGSVAYRTYSAILGTIYLFEAEGIDFFFGEGFSNYKNWISQRFANIPQSPFAEGNIGNAFSVICISTGVVGISLYLLFLWVFSSSINNRYFACFFILNILLGMSYANLTNPIYWTLMLVLRWALVSKSERS